MSDNYHQPVLGRQRARTAQPLGLRRPGVLQRTGMENPATTPPPAHIYNPRPADGDPQVLYTHRAQWFKLFPTRLNPEIGAITNYLKVLPYPVQTKCGARGRILAGGQRETRPSRRRGVVCRAGLVVPPNDAAEHRRCPPTARTIFLGSIMGGGFNADGTGPSSASTAAIATSANPFEYESELSHGGRRSHEGTVTRSVHGYCERHAAGPCSYVKA